MSKHPKSQTAATDFDDAVANVLAGANDGTISAPVEEPAVEQPEPETPPEDALIGVDIAGPGGDETVEPTYQGGEVVAQRRAPHNPERCVNVRIVYPMRRAYCTVEVGPRVTDDEFRVNGHVPEGEEDTFSAFAKVAALHLAQEVKRRDIEVIRIESVQAAEETAKALTEAGFHVITYPA